MLMFIIGIILCVTGTIGIVIINQKMKTIHTINTNIDDANKKLTEENLALEKSNIKLDVIRSNLENRIKQLTEEERQRVEAAAQSVTEQQKIMTDSLAQYCDTLEIAYLAEENEFDLKVARLTEVYERMREELNNEYEQDKKTIHAAFDAYVEKLCEEYSKAEERFDKELTKISDTIALKKEELDRIAATWKAAREAQIREEEILLKSDFYRLHLSELDANTIELIEQLKPRLPEPRVLSMLIWSTYFQKQTTALCNNVLGINKVCGIYKITNIKTGLCYIGQAVDIAERWKQHIKCGLGIDTPAQNKLYKAMFKDGITNFTFELLEQCERNLLNEKEKFYIGLYQSCDYGYNSTSGNK